MRTFLRPILLIVVLLGGCATLEVELEKSNSFGTLTEPSASPGVAKSYGAEWVALGDNDEVGRYFRNQDKIRVHVNGMITEDLKDADVDSFRVNRKFSEFGRDNTHVWFISYEMSVDPDTWEVLSPSYSKDRSKVYCGTRELRDADPETFRIIREGLAEWGMDNNAVYTQWSRLEGSDPLTFQFLGEGYSKDKGNVYYLESRLDGADPSTFEIIKGNVAKDKNSVFAFGKRMPSDIDRASVYVPGDGYIYDKNGRYHMSRGEWVKDGR